MQSCNKTISVIKKNEGDLFVALEFFECILYWVSGILYLLFCSFSLKRCPSNRIIFRVHKTWIHTPGLNTPGRWSYSSVRGSFYPREQGGRGGIWGVSGVGDTDGSNARVRKSSTGDSHVLHPFEVTTTWLVGVQPANPQSCTALPAAHTFLRRNPKPSLLTDED